MYLSQISRFFLAVSSASSGVSASSSFSFSLDSEEESPSGSASMTRISLTLRSKVWLGAEKCMSPRTIPRTWASASSSMSSTSRTRLPTTGLPSETLTSLRYAPVSKLSDPVCFRSGTRRQPIRPMNRTPKNAVVAPTGVKSNIANEPRPAWLRKPEIIRFGGVPISVVVPPSMEPKARGMRTFPGGMSFLSAICSPTGIRRARAPTLFINPERSAPRVVMAIILTPGPAESGRTLSARKFTAPVICKP